MTTIRDQIKAAIFGQESSSGAADTSQENYAGARGPMQVTKATFEGMKSKGLIPNDWSHDNPKQTAKAGNVLIDTLADKYQDDPQKVAAAYYAGEKAVRSDGTIADFRDKKNSNAPTTLQYVRQVMTRMGATPEAADAGGGPVSPTAQHFDSNAWRTTPMPDKAEQVRRGPQMAEVQLAPPADPTVLPGGNPLADQYAAEGTRLQAIRKEIDDTSFIEKSQAGWMHTGIAGAVLKQITRPEYEHTPGYLPRVQDKALYEGRTEDDQALLDTAHSPDMAKRLDWEINQRNEDLRTMNLSGTGVGIAAAIFGNLPEGYVTGLGTMKAFQLAKVGSLTLAAAGNKAAALGSALAENVVGNVGLTAIQSAFDPYVGKDDYAMAAGMSLVGTAFHLGSIGHTADSHQIKATGDKIMGDAATRINATREKAASNLGDGATPEQLISEMRRLEANGIRQEISASTATLPESRRLLPDMDEPKVEAPARATSTPESLVDTAVAKAEQGDAWRVADGAMDEARKERMRGVWAEQLGTVEGVNQRWLDKQAPGVHTLPEAAARPEFKAASEALDTIQKQFFPGNKVALGLLKMGVDDGVIYSAGDTHAIGLHQKLSPEAAVHTVIHEAGHVIVHNELRNVAPALMDRLLTEFREFAADVKLDKAEARFKRFHEGSPSVVTPEGGARGPLPITPYTLSLDEFLAEGFVRWHQSKVKAGTSTLPEKAVALMQTVLQKVKALYDFARGKGWLPKDTAVNEFFSSVADGSLKQVKREAPAFLDTGLTLPASFSKSADPHAAFVNDPIAQKYGITLIPQDTPAQRAEAKAVLHLYKRADEWAKTNPIDESRLKSITDNSVFSGAASTGLLMLKSQNPVVRMIASELLESASGAAGRRSTASIAKYMNERAYMGNSINDLQAHYQQWRNLQGGTVVGDFWDGNNWKQFNRLLAEEMESRLPGRARVDSPEQVVNAANMLEGAYDRMRVAQVQTKTVGWAALPESSVGYMPHQMSPEKVRNMTNAQAEALHSALVDQFVQIEGFDISFSANLASKYIDRVRRRALGGYEAPTGAHQVGAADVVQEALESMGLSRPEVEAMMGKYMAGGAGHTKKRLQLDLNTEHTDGAGGTFRLMDLFETDQLKLVRSQAQRVSGEVALARHGVMGKPGLALLRRAMEFGEDTKRTTGRELEAFDQVSAEFLGAPFGTQGGKWLDRAMQTNSLARLGGMGFTQFAEYINGIAHVGVARTLAAVGGFNRLRKEAHTLAKGEALDNPILSSIEKMGGAEFGTDAHKMVFPFDNGDLQYQTYGKDTVTFADRALRGGTHLQGKLSFWRAIHSAQHRGMAEQIVHKATKFIRDGGEDIALKDMGITPDVAARLRADLPQIAEFDAAGNLTRFDITKATDLDAADQFIQGVHRGTSQIIQGTFIGETNKWSHDGVAKLFTQFRTYGITSIEKQWSRQQGNHGTATALGILMGSMAAVAPIYIARTQLVAMGRPDREEYLDKQLASAQIARATLNYVAMSGLAGDFLDAFTAVSGVGKATGGRTAAGSGFVGNVIAPSAGLVDDVWKGIQNTKEGTDPHDLLKAMPFSRLPYMIPAIEGLGD